MDLLNLLSGQLGAVRFLMAFVLLPFLYLRESADVHREYATFLVELRAAGGELSAEVRNALAARLQAFDLHLWFVAAATAYLVAVSLLGNIADASSHLECRVETATVDAVAACAEVRGIVNAFASGLTVVGGLGIHWAKVQAYQALQKAVFVSGTEVAKR